jgi:hypothetical protein
LAGFDRKPAFHLDYSKTDEDENDLQGNSKDSGYIIRVMAGLSNVIIVYLMLSVCTDVVLRFFLIDLRPGSLRSAVPSPLHYLSRCGMGPENEGHVIVDILLTRVSPKTNAVLGIFSSIIGIFVCLIIFGLVPSRLCTT